MTAGKCDVKASYWASQHIYGYFLRNGVRVYEMLNRELHAKTATVDNMFAGVGSYNLDYLSYGRLLGSKKKTKKKNARNAKKF